MPPTTVEGRLASFDGATGWLNSPPLTPDGLRGKVILVDFWTYTCINWLRTLAYVRAWHERYAAQGLVVIGVHTPEFPFERWSMGRGQPARPRPWAHPACAPTPPSSRPQGGGVQGSPAAA